MDLEDLRLVAAIVEHGSLTAAAASLRVAQPASSRRLARIERELGGSVFDRGRHGAQPTAAGAVLADGAAEVLESLRLVEQRCRDVLAGSAGRLRVGTTPTLGADLLPPVLAAHRDARPGVRLELASSGDSDHLAAEVASGRVDVALAVVPASLDPRVRVAVDGPQPFVLVVPADHALGRLRSVPVAHLPRERMVVLKRGEGLRRLVDGIFVDLGATPDVSIETADREMLVPMVAAGLGVTVVPATFARQRATPAVILLPLRPAVERRVGALVRVGESSRLVADFVAQLDAAWPRPAHPGRKTKKTSTS